jgi:hypothetical protein
LIRDLAAAASYIRFKTQIIILDALRKKEYITTNQKDVETGPRKLGRWMIVFDDICAKSPQENK